MASIILSCTHYRICIRFFFWAFVPQVLLLVGNVHAIEPGASEEFGTCTELVDWTTENCLVGPVSIKVDISEDVFYQLCPKSFGKFEAPSSCDLYVSCHDGQLTVNRCPEFYHFRQDEQQCVQAETYECSHSVGKDASSILQAGSGREKRYYPTKNLPQQLTSQLSRADNFHWVQKRFAKNGRRRQGSCPENYIWPHPYDCSQYQICSNGRIFNQKCGPGTLFHPLDRTCAHSSLVDCTNKMSDYGTYDCQKGFFYTASDFEDCSRYIECYDGSLKIKTCSEGTVFNPEEQMCDFKYKFNCTKPISLEHDTDVNYDWLQHKSHSQRKSRNLGEEYSCEFNYIAPVKEVCNEFVECEDRRLFRKSCGPGTAYNQHLGQCDWPYRVRRADQQYCSRYFQCDGKYFVPTQCEPGLYFNPSSGLCEQHVDCSGKLDDPKNEDRLILS